MLDSIGILCKPTYIYDGPESLSLSPGSVGRRHTNSVNMVAIIIPAPLRMNLTLLVATAISTVKYWENIFIDKSQRLYILRRDSQLEIANSAGTPS